MALAFISILTLMNAEALSGFTMPARASPSSSQNYLILMNTNCPAGIAKLDRASTSISVSILMNAEAMSGFVPKGPLGLLKGSS